MPRVVSLWLPVVASAALIFLLSLFETPVSDKLHQHFVPGRHATPVDAAIDAVGVAVGVVLYGRVRT